MRHIGFLVSDSSTGLAIVQSDVRCCNLIIYGVGTFGHLNLLTGTCAAAVNIILHIGKSPKLSLVDYTERKRGGGAIEMCHRGSSVGKSGLSVGWCQ